MIATFTKLPGRKLPSVFANSISTRRVRVRASSSPDTRVIFPATFRSGAAASMISASRPGFTFGASPCSAKTVTFRRDTSEMVTIGWAVSWLVEAFCTSAPGSTNRFVMTPANGAFTTRYAPCVRSSPICACATRTSLSALSSACCEKNPCRVSSRARRASARLFSRPAAIVAICASISGAWISLISCPAFTTSPTSTVMRDR